MHSFMHMKHLFHIHIQSRVLFLNYLLSCRRYSELATMHSHHIFTWHSHIHIHKQHSHRHLSWQHSQSDFRLRFMSRCESGDCDWDWGEDWGGDWGGLWLSAGWRAGTREHCREPCECTHHYAAHLQSQRGIRDELQQVGGWVGRAYK